jgi:hypothetical protein
VKSAQRGMNGVRRLEPLGCLYRFHNYSSRVLIGSTHKAALLAVTLRGAFPIGATVIGFVTDVHLPNSGDTDWVF